MTGAGAPGAAGIIECLRKEKTLEIFAADANENAVGKFIVNNFLKIPPASDPSFIRELLRICRENNIQLVMPLVTAELIHLARAKHEFEKQGTVVMVSSPDALEIAVNKSRLYEFLQWRGIPVPDFRVVETVEQFLRAIEELGYPSKPVCFKPSISNGSRGFRIISNNIDESELLFRQKPNNTFITLSDAKRILSSQPFPELLVAEYLPGDEFSVDCVASDGEALIIVPRVRKKMLAGISIEGEFINDEMITGYCRQILHALKLNGNIGIQVKKSEAGIYLILEINPRVQGTISSALGAGVNLPLIAVKQALNQPVSQNELQVRWGTKFSRHWKEVFY